MENDVIAGWIPFVGRKIGGDKFRSNATEIGWSDYFIGTNVFATDPTIG